MEDKLGAKGLKVLKKLKDENATFLYEISDPESKGKFISLKYPISEGKIEAFSPSGVYVKINSSWEKVYHINVLEKI